MDNKLFLFFVTAVLSIAQASPSVTLISPENGPALSHQEIRIEKNVSIDIEALDKMNEKDARLLFSKLPCDAENLLVAIKVAQKNHKMTAMIHLAHELSLYQNQWENVFPSKNIKIEIYKKILPLPAELKKIKKELTEGLTSSFEKTTALNKVEAKKKAKEVVSYVMMVLPDKAISMPSIQDYANTIRWWPIS